MKASFYSKLLGILIFLIGFSLITEVNCEEITASTVCDILMPSDLDNWEKENPMGMIICSDFTNGLIWKDDIDVLSAGLGRNVVELVIDHERDKLYAWASIKSGGPGWRVFDLNELVPIYPATPLRELEGIEPRLELMGNYLVLFHRDSVYYVDFPDSRDHSTTYVFDAENLELLNQEVGACGTIHDKLFYKGANDHYWIASTWEDKDFPILLKYSLPDLAVVDSLETKLLDLPSPEQIIVKDIKADRILAFSMTQVAQQSEDESVGRLIVIELSSGDIISMTEEDVIPRFTSTKLSKDGERIFTQYGKGDSLTIYDSNSGTILNIIYGVSPRALSTRSYLTEDSLYIINGELSAFLLINSDNASEIDQIPIVEVD